MLVWGVPVCFHAPFVPCLRANIYTQIHPQGCGHQRVSGTETTVLSVSAPVS